MFLRLLRDLRQPTTELFVKLTVVRDFGGRKVVIGIGITLRKVVWVALVINTPRTHVADGIHSQYNALILPHTYHAYNLGFVKFILQTTKCLSSLPRFYASYSGLPEGSMCLETPLSFVDSGP